MKLKRHFALAIALILMLGLFAGCGGDTANSAPSAAPSAPASDETPSAAPDSSASTSGAGLKIALSSQHLTNDFNRGILAGVEAKAAELGAELITANAQGDSNKQVSDIENFLTMDVDAVIIGGSMIRESRSEEDEEEMDASFRPKEMLTMAVATSIDALAVGVSFAFLGMGQGEILSAAGLIAATTFVFSAVGVSVGSVFGSRFKSKAELCGGVILILIGLKILLEHLGILG